jgi:hypothetical protein
MEEKHRGDWQPLLIKVEGEDEKIQKIVRILPEQAERMNMYSNEEGIRYVLPKAVEKEVKDSPKPSKK